MSDESTIRAKLAGLFYDTAHNFACKERPGWSGEALATILHHMYQEERNRFDSRWKSHLRRLGVTRASISRRTELRLLETVPLRVFSTTGGYVPAPTNYTLESECSWRNLPGFYSIKDPIYLESQAKKQYILDIPREVGLRLLVLGSP